VGTLLALTYNNTHHASSILQRNKDALESILKSNHPDVAAAVRSEAEARAKYAELQQRLDKLEAIFSPEALASPSPDLQQLSQQLRKKEEEVRCLRLELKASLEVRHIFQYCRY
jgi:hypothetical protein